MHPLSVYIHWPFCKSKCPYCDFNSHVRNDVDSERWQKALLHELAYYAAKLPDRQVVSIFFGGGTPSLMPATTVSALIEQVNSLWAVSEDIEITLEANPTSIEAKKFRDFRKSGVNRVSIGVQSFEPEDLKFLGREHNVQEAMGALLMAADIFPRMSFDLIYARPNQTLAAWEAELTQALTYAKDHLSLYQLTIEENTAFHHTYHNGGFTLPEEGLAADMYMLTQDIMEANGLPAYEISNHAWAGQESRHNLAYWKSQDYIGIGAGAHGRYNQESGRISTENIKSPERWLEKVEQSDNGLTAETAISEKESLEEAVMMGLRLSSGIHYDEWQKQMGADLRKAIPETAIDKLREQTLIEADENHIKATRKGRLLLNRVTGELLS